MKTKDIDPRYATAIVHNPRSFHEIHAFSATNAIVPGKTIEQYNRSFSGQMLFIPSLEPMEKSACEKFKDIHTRYADGTFYQCALENNNNFHSLISATLILIVDHANEGGITQFSFYANPEINNREEIDPWQMKCFGHMVGYNAAVVLTDYFNNITLNKYNIAAKFMANRWEDCNVPPELAAIFTRESEVAFKETAMMIVENHPLGEQCGLDLRSIKENE